MKVAVVSGLHPQRPGGGENFEDVAPDLRFAHSICGSTYGIARALSSYGYEARPWEGAEDPLDVDALFVSERNFFDLLWRTKRWDFATKPAVVWFHDDLLPHEVDAPTLFASTAGICFTRPEARALFLARYGQHPRVPYWIAPWGFPDWWRFPPKAPSPYVPGTKNVVYAGRIVRNGRIRKWISSVAEAFPAARIHVITDTNDPEVIDELRHRANVNFLGARSHGTFLHYLYYADVALDTGIVEDRRANNCKLWDYLAAGVPVVLDGRTGGDELILETGGGVIVPANDRDAYLDVVGKFLVYGWPRAKRDETIAVMKARHAWEPVVSRWIDNFKAAVGG